MTKRDAYRLFCDNRAAAQQLRALRETRLLADGRAERDGKILINFAGNDYLGLSQHPALIRAAEVNAQHYGAGAAASRLVTGNGPLYKVIEEKLARGKGTEAALVLNSGYQANVSALAALADEKALGKPVVVLADRLCHNSILKGIALSGARMIRFHHNDYAHLAMLLKQYEHHEAQIIIVSESVFSMDGDRADLAALIELSDRYDALLYIDEAHATGLFGTNGYGLAAEHKGRIDVVMGTFGKALGGFGAYIACSQNIRDYLVQACGGLVYSTALPPAVLGTIEAALDLLPEMEDARRSLQAEAARLRDALRGQGWNCGASTTQIIPVIVGEEAAAIELAGILEEKGFLISAIRPPTVAPNASRLRISLSAAHKREDINKLIAVMATLAPRFAVPVQAQAS